MTFVEPDFWDRSVVPTRHVLDQFAARAVLYGGDARYLTAALRDLAIAEGTLVERPPAWAGLEPRAEVYVVVGRWACLPLYPHRHRPGLWEPASFITASGSDLSWRQALEAGWVRCPPPPPRPHTGPAWQSGATIEAEAQAAAGPPPPKPRWLPITASGWRAWRAWRTARQSHKRDLRLYRNANRRAANQAATGALQQWEHQTWPAYQQAWQEAYTATRDGRPAWARGPMPQPHLDAGSAAPATGPASAGTSARR